VITRRNRKERPNAVSARLGSSVKAQRITVNLSAEIGDWLRETAERCQVSESSVVEIALRQLLRRVNPMMLEAFLHEHGACLRRRKS
jgi:hypothetical protein